MSLSKEWDIPCHQADVLNITGVLTFSIWRFFVQSRFLQRGYTLFVLLKSTLPTAVKAQGRKVEKKT